MPLPGVSPSVSRRRGPAAVVEFPQVGSSPSLPVPAHQLTCSYKIRYKIMNLKNLINQRIGNYKKESTGDTCVGIIKCLITYPEIISLFPRLSCSRYRSISSLTFLGRSPIASIF